MNCPSCNALMNEQCLEGNYGKTVALDLCHACNGIWFDSFENLQLTPGSILCLFRLIHEKRADHRKPLSTITKCPRCNTRLVYTGDRQRSTRFHYDRCPRDHGRFITFFQFLREKNFVRSLNPKEVHELKQHIKMIHCSNCGAAVDLEREAACPYCRSPISMLDPQQIEKTVQELNAAEEKRTTIDPTFPIQIMHDRLKVEKLYRRSSTTNIATLGNLADPLGWYEVSDLVRAGIDVVVDTLGELS